jgi:hypothetical protein
MSVSCWEVNSTHHPESHCHTSPQHLMEHKSFGKISNANALFLPKDKIPLRTFFPRFDYVATLQAFDAASNINNY